MTIEDRTTLSYAASFFQGKVYYGAYNAKRGLQAVQTFVHEFGAVEAKDTDGICVDATATEAKTLSATGALVSGGVGTFTTPRNIAIVSTGNNAALTITVNGTDVYGETMSEDITGPNNATVQGAKAFKTVTSVTVTGAVTGNLDVGSHDVLGLPVRLADKGKLLAYTQDGVAVAPTIVAGFGATGTSTATTADVRGTLTATTAPNASIRFTAMFVPDGNKEKIKVFGAAQA